MGLQKSDESAYRRILVTGVSDRLGGGLVGRVGVQKIEDTGHRGHRDATDRDQTTVREAGIKRHTSEDAAKIGDLPALVDGVEATKGA